MPAEPRPSFDPTTHTHYLEMGAATYDGLQGPLAMADICLFAEAVTQDDWVWIESDDGRECLLRVTGIAAVLVPAPDAEAHHE